MESERLTPVAVKEIAEALVLTIKGYVIKDRSIVCPSCDISYLLLLDFRGVSDHRQETSTRLYFEGALKQDHPAHTKTMLIMGDGCATEEHTN
jgi:hypothetical protein